MKRVTKFAGDPQVGQAVAKAKAVVQAFRTFRQASHSPPTAVGNLIRDLRDAFESKNQR